jgi:hypothetical protein
VQLAADSVFSNLIISDSLLIDTTRVASSLSYETKYYWRVRARNLNGYGPFSSRRSFTTLSSTEVQPGEGPVTYALHQNYPNPFNPSTRIEFDLPSSTYVSLKVYDVLGREVASLLEGVSEAGRRHAEFSADRLGSGIYFCTLKAGAYTRTMKMVLLR